MIKRRPITPVIFSGGSGTRLWPPARTRRLKQLLALTHVTPMLQLIVAKASGERFATLMVVASAALAAYTAVPDAILLVMPSGHVITDLDGSHTAIERAVPLVAAG